MLRRAVGLLAAGSLILACTGGSSSDPDALPTIGGPRRLIEDDTLTVCVDAPKYPSAFQDSAGTWLGSDIEVVQALADDLDLELAIVAVPFDGIWRAPAAGTCDVAAAAITITDARSTEAFFTTAYMEAGQSLLVRTENAESYATLAGLAGKPIGVKGGTTSEAYLTANLPAGATAQAYDETEDLFLALGAHEVDAVFGDFPLNGYRATLDNAVTVTERFNTDEQYGLAIARDNGGLVDDLNEALRDYVASSEYRSLLRRWFGIEPATP